MSDDPQDLAQRAAYLDRIRGLYRRERTAGFAACLIGVLVMLAGRFRPDTPSWVMWAGVAIIAGGWSLFAFVIFRRSAWVRAHPFDLNG